VNVTWVHFPLHPETPAEGVSLEELFAGRDVDMDAMRTRMKGLMEAEELPYGERSHTYNSRLAQELGKWADTQSGGGGIHDALFKAYFVDALNIGDPEVLIEIARSIGLSEAEARGVLESRSFSEAIDQDWTKSRQYGVTGVPTFVAGGYGVVGAQSYETLAALLEKVGGVEPRA
jgi:predicted DsbA family dithiol-disulfide isomerase